MSVGYRKDHQQIPVHKIVNAVRESADRNPTHILVDDRIHLRIPPYLGEALFNAQQKIRPKAGVLILIPPKSAIHVAFGFRTNENG
jgi:hypothetical protein